MSKKFWVTHVFERVTIGRSCISDITSKTFWPVLILRTSMREANLFSYILEILYSESQIYEYIARVFHNVVFSTYLGSTPRKIEFNIYIAFLHISGLLIYLELKIKNSFLKIIKNLWLYNAIWIYFHKSYSTLWSCEHLSSFLFVQNNEEA